MDRKIVNFQVFADSVHQAELERYQGHIKLDQKIPIQRRTRKINL